MSAPWRCREAPLRSDGQIALFHTQKGTLIKIMVTLNTIRPSEHRYRLFGTAGSVEMFTYEECTRYFDSGCSHKDGWRVLPVSRSAVDDATGGHGGTDLKIAGQFTDNLLKDRPSSIDVYRAIDYDPAGHNCRTFRGSGRYPHCNSRSETCSVYRNRFLGHTADTGNRPSIH